MRINRLHIYGFGHFSDQDFGPLDTSVTVLYGPNEAGKSTLLAFIRCVLFGFPSRGGAQHYPPLAGGRHGGDIIMSNQEGLECTVRRLQGKGAGPLTITDSNGETLDETSLGPLLGNHTGEVFNNIFAFTLDELHSDRILKDDSVNSQMHSASMGALTLPDTLKKIDNKINGLYRKRGRHKIAEVARNLADVETKLREVASYAEKYRNLTAKLEQIEKEREGLSELRRQHQSDLEYQQRLKSAWDDWNDLVACEESVVDIEVVSDFRVDDISRLEGLEEGIRRAQKEYDSACGEAKEAQSKATVQFDCEAILEHSATIRGLEQGREHFESAARDLPERKIELEELERSLGETLKDLGTDWDEGRLEDFDLSIAIREQVSKFEEHLRKASEELERQLSALAQDRKALQEAVQKEFTAQQEIESAIRPSRSESEARERRSLIRAATLQVQKAESHKRHLAILQDQIQGLRSSDSTGVGKKSQKLVALICILLGLALIFGGLAAGEVAILIGMAAGLAFVGVAIYLFVSVLSSPRSEVDSPLTSPLRESLARTKAELEEFRVQHDQYRSKLGLEMVDETSLIAADSSLDHEVALMREWVDLSKTLEDAENSTKHRKRIVELSEEAVVEKETQLEAAKCKWREWLRARELHDGIMPQTVNVLQTKVELGLSRLQEIRRSKDRIKTIQTRIDNYVKDLEILTTDFDIAVDKSLPSSFGAAADRLIDLYKEIEEQVRKRTDAEEALESVERRLAERKRDLRKARQRCRICFCPEEPVTAKSSEGVKRFTDSGRTSKREFSRRATGCSVLAVPGERLEALQNTLQETNIKTISDSTRHSKEQLEVVEARIMEMDTERGSNERELQSLTSEEESSKQRAKHSLLLEQLHYAAREWAIHTLARRLLEEARSKFERERQPGVVRHAEAFFSEITDGRYDKVAAPLGQKTIRVAGADGLGKEPSTLSRGTREQLFLSLRFGLVRELGERTEPLPVIVDEVLVNFDPERALRAAKAFTELSHSNQVLIFTCHPTIVEHFQEAANQLESPEPKVIQID